MVFHRWERFILGQVFVGVLTGRVSPCGSGVFRGGGGTRSHWCDVDRWRWGARAGPVSSPMTYFGNDAYFTWILDLYLVFVQRRDSSASIRILFTTRINLRRGRGRKIGLRPPSLASTDLDSGTDEFFRWKLLLLPRPSLASSAIIHWKFSFPIENKPARQRRNPFITYSNFYMNII